MCLTTLIVLLCVLILSNNHKTSFEMVSSLIKSDQVGSYWFKFDKLRSKWIEGDKLDLNVPNQMLNWIQLDLIS